MHVSLNLLSARLCPVANRQPLGHNESTEVQWSSRLQEVNETLMLSSMRLFKAKINRKINLTIKSQKITHKKIQYRQLA